VLGKPANGLTLSAAVAYNRAKYAENFLAACDPGWVDPATNLPAIPGCTPFSPETPAQGVVAAVDQLPNAPKWKAVVSGEYEHPLTDRLWIFAQADVNYRSGIYLSEVPDVNRLGDQTRIGARLGVRSDDDRWGVAVFGRNLNQKRFLTGIYRDFFSPNDILFQTYTPDSTRVVGVTLDMRF
jgi:iron complex outermembrane receptor protein